MKKLLVLVIMCYGAVSASPRAYRVTGSSVNVRSENNEKAKVITALPKGSIIEIDADNGKPAIVKVGGTEGSWLSVSGISGYIFSAFVEPAPDAFQNVVREGRECKVSAGYLDCGAEFGGKRKLAANVVILMAEFSTDFADCCNGKQRTLIQKGTTTKKIDLTHMTISAVANEANEIVTISGWHGGHGCGG